MLRTMKNANTPLPSPPVRLRPDAERLYFELIGDLDAGNREKPSIRALVCNMSNLLTEIDILDAQIEQVLASGDPGAMIASKELFGLRNRAVTTVTSLVTKSGLSLAGRKEQRDANRQRERAMPRKGEETDPVSLFA
jgi:hypothetical protein